MEPSMLMVARRCYETILINDDIEITVVHIGDDNVRLGITGPPEVRVYRKEAKQAIHREDHAAVWRDPSFFV
jgi:carbon storage regulator